MGDESQDIQQVSSPDEEARLITEIRDTPDDQLVEEYARLRLERDVAPIINFIGSDLAAALVANDLATAIGNTDEKDAYLANIREYYKEVEGKKRGSTPTPSQRNQQTGADPVQLFNGEFTHEAEDVHINGAGMDLMFRRVYRNQVVFSGPLGANWDHGYNLHLKASDTDLILTTGELREQHYTRHPTLNYFVPPDGIDAIFEAFGESFVRRTPDGIRHIFEPDLSLPSFHHLARIEDRIGNFLQFEYRKDSSGLLDLVLVNHSRRMVRFAYDTLERITEITDHTGRTWRYAYDDLNDLIAVTTPATDRYPCGLTTRYEYRTAFTNDLSRHNLQRIIDPADQLYLENEYGESPGQVDYNRVIRQRQGGGETTFEYEDIAPVFERDYTEAQIPKHQTTMVDRNGHLIHHVYNKFGNLLFKEECIIENGLPRTLFERYRYNRDGQLIASLSPEGVLTQQLTGRELFMRRNNITNEEEVATHGNLTPQERLGFGRALVRVRRGQTFGFQDLNQAQNVWGDFPDIIGGFVPDNRDIIIKFTHEPVYGQLLTVSDPRFTQKTDPTIQTLAAGEHPRYDETLTRYTYRGPEDNPNVDPTRLLAEIRHPTPTLPDGTAGDPVVERFEEYDERGRLLRHVNPIGTVTLNSYFNDRDEREGYLRRKIIDPNGLAITTEYEVDSLGRVIAVHLPRSVGAPPGHFVNLSTYNELDQITRSITSAPFNFEIRRFYDRNGKLEREERDAKDDNGADIPGAPEVHTFAYDEEFNLVRESVGGANLAVHLVTHQRYDTSGQRTVTILPEGNQMRFAYDERRLPVAKTMGAGSEEAATTQMNYDGDRRVRRTVSGRGNANTFTLDPFGRVIAEEDALGHIIRRDYDKLGNVTCLRTFELQGNSSYRLLSRSETEYDELGRAVRSGVNRFDEPLDPVQEDELDEAFLPSPGPSELLITQTFYDVQGRVRHTIDPLGRIAALEYDALDRVIAQTDPLGNRIENHYNAHGNLVRRDRRDAVLDPATSAIIAERVFSTTSTYDELDRLVSSTDSLGNRTRYFYDSRGNQVKRIDPLGNVILTEYDIFNRRIVVNQDLTDTGLGGGVMQATVTTSYEYDRNGNLAAVIDGLGRRTQFLFDTLDRRRAIIYPDESQRLYDYDRDGNLIRSVDNNGLQRHYTVDELGRTTRVEVDKSSLSPGLTVEGATFERYEYDGLDRQRQVENDFAQCNIRFNSLGWPLAERMTFTTPDAPLITPIVIRRQYNHNGSLIGLTYPNERRISFLRDDLDRLIQVRNLAKGDNYPGNPTTPDVHNIAEMVYGGRQRIRDAFGNGSTTRYAHDGAGRILEIAHRSPSDFLLTIQYLYDAAGNERLRHDISPTRDAAEIFAYDSLYRLVNGNIETRPVFNPVPLTPAASVPADPIPNRQAELDSLIGSLALPAGRRTFDYDLAGNRQSEHLADGSQAGYTINELDQYTRRDGRDYTYDGNGNLRGDDRREYIYDSLNRLVKVTNLTTGEAISRFFHDAYGRRILELSNSLATHLIWDRDDQIAEYRNGVPFAMYVFDDEVDRPVQIAAEGDEHWYHGDLVGSVRLLTDKTGSEAVHYRYDPFGVTLEDSREGIYNPLRYTARRLDKDLETYDYRARQYDPELGRFIQRDPAGMIDGTNLYTYTKNTPLTFIDPSGTSRDERVVLNTPRGDKATSTLISGFLSSLIYIAIGLDLPTSRTPVVFWSGYPIAMARAAKVAAAKGGFTIASTRGGRLLDWLYNKESLRNTEIGEAVLHAADRIVSASFAFKAGFLGQPKQSVIRVPEKIDSIRSTVELPSYQLGQLTRGTFKVVGGLSTLLLIDDTRNKLEGRIQVDLEGLDPSDFDVGTEFKDVPLGQDIFGTIKVERNIIGVRKFYIVSAGIRA